jgi:glycosyltransferase involved in cell wall biosynthesis
VTLASDGESTPAGGEPARLPGTRGRVCFFASHVWPAFETGRIEFAGGAETQQAVLARGLVRCGFDVTVATCDYGQGRRVEREGIRFLATHVPTGGLPVLRFFHPRLTGNLRALLASRAEVFYVRGAGYQLGLAGDVAHATRAGLVFAAAHDGDADRSMPLAETPRDRWWAARAIRSADAVIAQTRAQAESFGRNWGRECVVIPNLVEPPAVVVDAGARSDVLWLSTYKDAKRPDDVVTLARRLPRVRFRMAGVVPPPPFTPRVFERIRAAAEGLPNLEVGRHVHREAMGAFFASGGLFLHTSPAEGFPNTLLEAWAHGLPTVSRVDPDRMVEQEGLGTVVDDLEEMEGALRRWVDDPAGRRAAGARARAVVIRDHAPSTVVDRLAQVLDQVRARTLARRRKS